MNKFLTKIAKIFLGLSMAAGVGVAIGTSNKNTNSAYAAATYEQLTSIANIDESAQYVLGVEGSGSGKGFHKSGTSSWGVCTASDTETPLYYTLKKGANNANFTAKTTISGTTYYLQVPTSNTFSMNTSSTAANTTLIIGTTQVSGTNYAVANSGTTNRHLRVNGTSGLRSYAGTTGSMAFFYKVNSQSTTYTVTYDGNGATSGTAPTDSNSPYDSGETVTVIGNTGNLAKTDYTFDGWNTAADGSGDPYEEDDEFTITANTTLYAQWLENSSGGDSDYSKATSIAVGDVIVLVCEGSSFEMTSFSGTSTEYGVGTSYSSSIAGTFPFTVEAGYSENTFSFKNGSNYLYWGSGNSLSKNSTKSNNSSWTVSIDGSGNATIANKADATRIIWWNVGNPRFACYTSKSDGNSYKYTQLYKLNQGSQDEPNVTLDPVSLSLIVGGSSETITATPNEHLSNPVYSWAIKNGSDNCVSLSNSTSNIVTVTPTGSAWSATATLVLTVTSSTDQTVNISKEVTVKVEKISSLDSPYSVADARQAYSNNVGLTGAFIRGTIVSVGDYNSTYHSLSYYISDDGTTTDQLQVYSGKGLNGADFSSTNDLVAGQHLIICGNIGTHSNVVQINSNSQIKEFDSHTVTFNAGEGTVSPTSVSVTCGGTTTLPTPTRSGYTFDGWLKNGSGNPIAAGATTDRIVADTTYVASWSMVQTLVSISLSGTYTTSFPRNSQFNHNGVVVTAHYEEEGAEDKTVTTLAQFSSPDMSTTGTKTVTVTYSENEVEVSATYTITVTGIISGITTTMPASLKLDLEESSSQYTATIKKDEGVSASVVWLSSDPTVATVNNGTITAAAGKIGTATITVFADADADGVLDEGEYKSTCTVKVVDPNALTDTLTYSLIGVTGSSYTDWSNVSDATSAVYKGKTAGGNTSIQFNVTSSNKGYIANSASAGYIRSVELKFNSSCSSSRTFTLYGATSPLDDYNAVIDTENTTTILGTASTSASGDETITVDSSYEFQYFGLVGTGGASYVDEIIITYEKIDTTPSITLIGETSISGMEGHTDSTSLSVKVKNISSPTFTFTFDEGGNTGLLTSSYISVEEGTPEDNVYPLEIQLLHPGTSVVHLNVSGQTASFTVTVTAAVPSVSFTNPTTSVLIGEIVTNVATGENLGGATISYTSGNESIATVTSAGVVTGVAKGSTTITATATVQGVDYSDSYTIQVVDAWPYTGVYILKSEGSYRYSGADYTFKDEFNGVSSKLGTDSDYIFAPKALVILTITASSTEGQYLISYNDGSTQYLKANANKELDITTDNTDANAVWTLESTENGLTATNVEISGAKIQYNPNPGSSGKNGRFAAYTSSQKAAYFIPYGDMAKAGAFVETYMHPEIEDNETTRQSSTTTCYDYFDDAKDYLDDHADIASTFAEEIDFAAYWERYVDWGLARNYTITYSNDAIQYSVRNNISYLLITENTNSVAIIVIISMVSVTAIGGYFFLRKRKENN